MESNIDIGPKKTDQPVARLHQVTFCQECSETIPARALTCFRCNAKQDHGEKALQIVFCEKCGEDYPARALACFHCGHLNRRHPYLGN